MAYTGEKKKEYDRLWVAKRRSDFFQDKTCENCGSNEKLELHHRDPALKESHSIWSWTKVRRDKEIEKCDVLCEGCHLKETIKQLTVVAPHGTWNTYDKGCRCLECNAFRAGKIRERRKKQKLLQDVV
jgi:hypothetical protein